MSSTLTVMQAAVVRRLGRPSTDTLLTSTDLLNALNDAAHAYAIEYPWRWLETSENISTTTGADSYAIPTVATTYIDTIAIRISGNPPLTRMSKAELDRQYPSTSAGTPVAFARQGGLLFVRPIPITTVLPTLVHIYHRDEADLASGSDVLLLPRAFDQIVVEYAAAEMHYRAADKQRGDICMSRYEALRNRMLEFERRGQAQSDGNNSVPPQPQMPLPGKATAASSA